MARSHAHGVGRRDVDYAAEDVERPGEARSSALDRHVDARDANPLWVMVRLFLQTATDSAHACQEYTQSRSGSVARLCGGLRRFGRVVVVRGQRPVSEAPCLDLKRP